MNFASLSTVGHSGHSSGQLRGTNIVKKLAVVVGVVLVLAGLTFGAQGLGIIGGSAMSGKTAWAVIGPLIALVGVVLVVAGLRGGARTPARDQIGTPQD
jgi:hypothetical protein